MAKIKTYTDINQSKKLAEILPLDSADMYYWYGIRSYDETPTIIDKNNEINTGDIPCWSLSALLGVLEHPRVFQGDNPIYSLLPSCQSNWLCGCFAKDSLYHEVEADNPVDACYEMIIKLHEQNLL